MSKNPRGEGGGASATALGALATDAPAAAGVSNTWDLCIVLDADPLRGRTGAQLTGATLSPEVFVSC